MLKREAQAFFSALQFLTRLPVPAWTGWEDGRLDRAAAWFPLVGLLVGGVSGAVYVLASLALAPGIAALLAIGAALLLTMGLHEDGLADFTDGVGGGRDREHMLAIMKDSRVGSYGVLALILSVGLRAASLAALAPMAGAVALIGAHGLSRCLMRLALLRLDYARPEGEAKVAPLSPEESLPRLVLLLALTALALLPFLAIAPSGIAFGTILLSLLAGIAMRALMRHRLGGWTGDGIGAVQQASETAFLIGASVWIST